MSITTYPGAFLMWDALVNAMKAEMGAGKRLATLVDVAQSAQLLPGAGGPCAAVQLTETPTTPFGIDPPTLEMEVQFKILIGTFSAGTDDRPANLDDAMAALRPLVDDGAGNGLIPVLNTPSLWGLGQGGVNVTRSMIGKGVFDWALRSGPDQRVWAYFLQTYTVTALVTY